jgi:hypothetical protein
MEPIVKDSGKMKGCEVLFFEDVELEKIKGNSTSFASMGTLSVLYFKEYSRFVLLLNDWKYPLLRRVPIISSSRTDNGTRTYILPSSNGFSFQLRLHKITSQPALSNFETILNHNSSFSFKGEESNPFKKIETSPDDKLVRHLQKESGPKEMITEMVKSGIEKIKVITQSFKSKPKGLKSTKKRMNLKDIKKRNFRKCAKPTIKKDFFTSNEKLTEEFLHRRLTNPCLSQSRDFESLKHASENEVPCMFICRDELEEAILHNKDIASKGNFTLVMPTEKKSFMENLKSGMTEIKDTFTSMLGGPSSVSTSQVGQGPMETHSRTACFDKKPITETYMPSTESTRRTENLLPESRDIIKDRPMPTGPSTQSKLPGFEGMTHYQG